MTQLDERAISRRRALQRFGQWSLGAAAVAAGVLFGAKPAEAGVGCCVLAYSRRCGAQEWDRSICGFCGNGKWWWSCEEGQSWRFCGESCACGCSYTFTYSPEVADCNAGGC